MMVRMLRMGTRSASRLCSTRTTVGERQHARHQILDQLRRGLAEAVEQLLHFLVAEDLVGVRLDDEGEMGGDHRARIDHGVAERLGMIAARGSIHTASMPKAGSRVAMPCSGPKTRPGVDGELLVGVDDALADRHAAQVDAVDVRREVEVVADVHGRDQEAELLRELAAHAAHAAEQIAALALVDQRHQAIADFETDEIDRADVVPGELAGFRRRRRTGFGAAAASGRAPCAACLMT